MAKMFIDGERVDSETGATTEIHNPATGEFVDSVPLGGVADTRRAIDAAERAFRVWSETPPAKRGAILGKAADLILEHEKELARILTLEQGKPIKESILETRRFVHTLGHYAGMGKSMRGGFVSLEKGRYGLIVKRPVGICGAIVPWNFPTSLMANKVAPALLVGDTMVVKPAGTTPLTATRCIELVHEAGLPNGVLNCVTGPGSVVGEELITNPKVRKIGFTGETGTGTRVMAKASPEVKRVTLELGGSDPMIVCDDADIDQAVSAASVGRFFNCGQACLAIKRLYLFEKIADAFIEKLVQKVRKIRIGNGLSSDAMMGPLHTAQQRQEIEEMVADAVSRGGKVLCGGERPQGQGFDKGFFYLPTLVTDVDHSARIFREECFGPALPIMRVRNLEEAIEKANDSIFGLGSSVWTRDINRALRAAEQIDSGYTWVNSAQIIYDELPFGGLKQSGVGKEHGTEALDYYTETKSIVVATGEI
jgi:succinate-semialdehyde dehydrogenase/glutarate-semialdehyde dehydrogenase